MFCLCFFCIKLIFATNSTVLVGGALKILFSPDAGYLEATALVFVNHRAYKQHCQLKFAAEHFQHFFVRCCCLC